MKNRHYSANPKILLLISFVVGLMATYFTSWQPVFAGTLTKSTIMEYNMQAGGQGNIAIEFTAASNSGASPAVSVNLSNLSTSLQSASLSVSGGTCNTSPFSTGTPFNGTTPSDGSGIVSFTSSTTFSTGTTYCTIITASPSLITNPAAGAYTALLTAGADSQTDAVYVVSGTSNAYTVSSTVPSSFTMSISPSTDALGTLSSTAVSTSTGVTVSVNTNSASGWLMWASDANSGLKSLNTGHTISSVSTSSNITMSTKISTDGFALGVTSVTSGSATGPYADSGGGTGAGLSTSLNEIAYDSSTSSATNNVGLKEMATILATDQASNDYNDTITIVGAGSF
jgi:hypothetical protein